MIMTQLSTRYIDINKIYKYVTYQVVAPTASKLEKGGQAVQELAPIVLYVFAGHGVQDDEPSLLNLPAGQA